MILRKRLSRTIVVIPARLGSTRFPGKVLKPLGGIPVLEWCRRAALRSNCGPVVVATDHPEVMRAVERYGGAAVLTAQDCASGTDRVHRAVAVVEAARGSRFHAVVNLQGDEPFIRPATIRKVAQLVENGAEMGTAVVPLPTKGAAADPNTVKAVVAADGRCLYFSRQAVPYGTGPDAAPRYQHIGIYGFARSTLDRFVALPASPLEKSERLEQLRALEAGISISAVRVADSTIAIDTPADLKRALRLYTGAGNRKSRRGGSPAVPGRTGANRRPARRPTK